MRISEGRVKWLNGKPFRVAVELPRAHERHGPEAADVAVVQRATIIERELERGVRELAFGERSLVDEQGTSEPGLNDQRVTGRELDDDQLRPPPAPRDQSATNPPRQCCRRGAAEYVGAGDGYVRDPGTGDRPVQVAGNRLGLRKLRHFVALRATRCPNGTGGRRTRWPRPWPRSRIAR